MSCMYNTKKRGAGQRLLLNGEDTVIHSCLLYIHFFFFLPSSLLPYSPFCGSDAVTSILSNSHPYPFPLQRPADKHRHTRAHGCFFDRTNLKKKGSNGGGSSVVMTKDSRPRWLKSKGFSKRSLKVVVPQLQVPPGVDT